MIQATLKLRKRTPAQKRIHESKKRFNVACWGRQSGKTTTGLDKKLYRPLQGRPEGVYWYILQTHDAAEVAFNRYWKMFDGARDLLLKKPNESEKLVTLCNRATVFFKSGENYEDLRAETLDGVIIDEYRQQHPDLWPRVIRPMLARHKGWADFYSTPNGFDHFYDLYQFALLHADEWGVFHAPSTEAWWWTPQEIASAKAQMSEAEFAQEILAEFRDLTQGKAYVNYGKHNELTQNPFAKAGELISPYLPICIGPDFNLNPMAWTLAQVRSGQSYFFNEIYLKNSHTQEAAKELVTRILEWKSAGLVKANPNVIVSGDATAKAGQRAAAAQSDYDIFFKALRDAEITYENRTPESNPHVKDRVNTVNAKHKAADGSVHSWLHPAHCKYLKRDYERVVWKSGTSAILDQTTNPELTHLSDGAGYLMHALTPIEGIRQVGGLRVIMR